jgi:hypothetical protein
VSREMWTLYGGRRRRGDAATTSRRYGVTPQRSRFTVRWGRRMAASRRRVYTQRSEAIKAVGLEA